MLVSNGHDCMQVIVQSILFEPVISIMRYGGKCLWKTLLEPICHLDSLQISGVPEYRTAANKCQWHEFYLKKILFYKSQGDVVCYHPNSSMTNKESFKHCSSTPKSPQTYPSERVLPSLLYVTAFPRAYYLPNFSDINIQAPICHVRDEIST